MIPKGKLLALLMVFTAVGGLAATGAFTTVEAERTAEVNVDGDANALLAIQPIPNDGNSDFIQQSDTQDQTFELRLDDAVNAKASTTAEDLINITNNGEEPVDVWIVTQGGEQLNNESINTTFYISSEHIVDDSDQTSVGEGEVALSDAAGSPQTRPLAQDIETYNAFVDGASDASTSSQSGAASVDAVISESESDSSEDQSPGKASAVSIAPGESITVSFAVEIDDGVPSNADILNNITIFAINDDEDADSTVDQELATSPGSSTETTAS
jgi:hypothetical protein